MKIMQSELTDKLNKYAEDCLFYYDLPGLAIGAGIGTEATPSGVGSGESAFAYKFQADSE